MGCILSGVDILCVIPVRGGSKRIPRKNLRLLGGKPLLVRTIEQARQSSFPLRLVVSTEDDEISKVAKLHGVDVIRRPESLAQDDTPTCPVIKHVLESLDWSPLVIVILQVTSPLRKVEDIDSALRLFFEHHPDSVTSTCNEKENGAVYVTRRNLVMNGTLYGFTLRYLMPPERSIDLDTEEDWKEAERLLSQSAG